MTVSPTTFSEARYYGQAGYVVRCDGCGRVQDVIAGFWLDEHRAGRLYRGEIVCWRCKTAKRGITDE